MRNIFRPAIILLLIAPLFSLTLYAQEAYLGPYTGNDNYKIGDLVEAAFAGSWVKAVVVGVDQAPSKYKVHFDGEKWCNDHATDSYYAREFVRPRKTLDNNKTSKPLPSPQVKPTPSAGSTGRFNVGDKVIYTNVGSVWLSGATVEAYDAEKRTYTLRLESGSGDIVPCHRVAKAGQFDNTFFAGKWYSVEV
jgi:hypothetical protein